MIILTGLLIVFLFFFVLSFDMTLRLAKYDDYKSSVKRDRWFMIQTFSALLIVCTGLAFVLFMIIT